LNLGKGDPGRKNLGSGARQKIDYKTSVKRGGGRGRKDTRKE